MPAARKDDLVVQELPEEVLVYNTKRHTAHCLNPTAALVWKHCDGQTTVTDMLRILRRELNQPVDEAVVWLAVRQLEKARLLAAHMTRPEDQISLSRREVVRRVGVAAAVTLPLVTSVIAPMAIQAGSCRAAGQPCTTSVQCCSGICNGAPTGTCA